MQTERERERVKQIIHKTKPCSPIAYIQIHNHDQETKENCIREIYVSKFKILEILRYASKRSKKKEHTFKTSNRWECKKKRK